jgi:hypothetical protein
MKNNTLNPSFNQWLTDITNSELGVTHRKQRRPPTVKERTFLKRCYDINVVNGFPFSKHHFVGMTNENFRQYIHNLRPWIQKQINSRPAFYRLIGIKVEGITINDTEVNTISINFESKLRECKKQPPQMHDLRIETFTSGLYEALLKVNKPHTKNKQIHLSMPNISTRFKTKVSVSQNGRLLLMIACTQKPVPYSISGFNELIEYISKVSYYLMGYSNFDFIVGPVSQWRMSYYHLNQDLIIDSSMFKYKIENLQEHSVTYQKELDGKKVLRHEKTISPNKTIEEEQTIAMEKEQERKINEWCDDETAHPVVFKKANELSK